MILLIGFLSISLFFVWFVPDFLNYRKITAAAGGLTYQIGLVNALVTPCTLTPTTPPICTNMVDPLGTAICATKDQATCSLYTFVSGTPAGGMGNTALLQTAVVSRIGLTSGGQLIAGGTSPVLMDNGVAASFGGTFMAVARPIDKMINWFSHLL